MANHDIRTIDQSPVQEIHNVPEVAETTREEVVEQWGGEEEAQAVKKLMAEFNAVHERDQALAKSFKAEIKALLFGSDQVDARALEDMATRIRQAGQEKINESETTFIRMKSPERAARQEIQPKPIEAQESTPAEQWDAVRSQMVRDGYIDAKGGFVKEIPGWTADEMTYLQNLQREKWSQVNGQLAA